MLLLNPYTDIFSVQLTLLREPDQSSHGYELGKNVYVDVVLILFSQHLETMHELLHIHISFSEVVLTMTHFQGRGKVWAKFHFPVMNVSWRSICSAGFKFCFLIYFSLFSWKILFAWPRLKTGCRFFHFFYHGFFAIQMQFKLKIIQFWFKCSLNCNGWIFFIFRKCPQTRLNCVFILIFWQRVLKPEFEEMWNLICVNILVPWWLDYCRHGSG